MKQSRFTEDGSSRILREHEAGSKTGDVCRKHGISSATFYKWKANYGGLDVSEARRLKVLTDDNAKLMKLLADAMLKDLNLKKMVTPVANGKRWLNFVQVEVSRRRACAVIGADRTSVCYRSVRPDDVVVRARLRELANIRRRFGCRCLLLL